MFKKFKYHIFLFLGLLVGAIVLQVLLNSYYASQKQQQRDRLKKVQTEAVLRVETGINIYATIISSIRAYIQNSETFPNENETQHFLQDLIKEVNFKDSIVVSFVDTNQVFQYVVTPTQLDPFHLKGVKVSAFRPDFEIKKLNALMHQNNISLFDPINLKEGWTGFPFNFAAKNKNGKVLGYIAPVLNVKYLLDYTYLGGHDTDFVHSFVTGDKFDLTREEVIDGTPSYNKNRDKEYYKNFNVAHEDFIYTDVNFYGLKLRIGSAYKNPPSSFNYITIVTYAWFLIICLLCIFSFLQLLKNNRLNLLLKSALKDIATKNNQLENNLLKIQTLIKEIHHRVKNNMQIISSLLNLQRNDEQDENIVAALDESKRRIQSMALVHQKLYGTQDLSHINVSEYVEQLVDSVENTLNTNIALPAKNIIVAEDLYFNVDTMIPLGLILNELVTNSYKHAFNDSNGNTMKIEIIKETEDNYQLVYLDSGKGIPNKIDFKNSNTLGLELIHTLTNQLDGTVSYSNKNNSIFTIKFKSLKE